MILIHKSRKIQSNYIYIRVILETQLILQSNIYKLI